jgi:hypothetical protein
MSNQIWENYYVPLKKETLLSVLVLTNGVSPLVYLLTDIKKLWVYPKKK